jgi:hypothetical protein
LASLSERENGTPLIAQSGGRAVILRAIDSIWRRMVGQAKLRSAAIQKWLAGLTDEERVCADAAQRLLQRFIDPAEATGMCYRLVFFLHLYLKDRGILTNPVVGYLNDGTDDVMVSHAWLELSGKKTDLTLGRTERPAVNPPGDILILDFPVRRGHGYTYHLEKTPEAIAVEEHWLREPDAAGLVRHKAAEHDRMLRLSADPIAMHAFLDAAPDGLTYARLASIID